MPDSPSTDTVIYMFDKTVGCNQIVAAGWDTVLVTGTQILEMKLFGTAVANFTVTTSHTPAPGEASVNLGAGRLTWTI